MARTRDDKAHAERRREILDAAEKLFIESGFHQTGMAAICAAAGISPGALYRYFPSKTAIIRGIVEDEAREAALWLDAVEAAPDLVPALIDALDAAIREVADADYRRLALEIGAEAARDSEIGAILASAQAEVRMRIARVLALAGRTETADANAEIIMMLIDGAISAGANFAAAPETLRRERLGALVLALME
jgi:AcrR family transcriptional regulator